MRSAPEACAALLQPSGVNRWLRAAGSFFPLLMLAGLCGSAQRSAAAGTNAGFSTLTHRSQLAQLPEPVQHLQWTADLEGTVLAGGHELALVSFDALDQTRIIDARGSRVPLRKGQRIRYRGNWLIGDASDRPDRWAAVNNDGTHSMLPANIPSGSCISMRADCRGLRFIMKAPVVPDNGFQRGPCGIKPWIIYAPTGCLASHTVTLKATGQTRPHR
jgi:hypothetical protein